jgi:protein-tyrosine phosphatase
VLSLRSKAEDRFFGTPPTRFHRIPVDDYQAPSMDQLKEAVQFIDECTSAQLPTLVHCKAGVGRSPLTMAAYLVSKGKSRIAATDYIWRARPIIDLNTVQLARLMEWEWYVQNSHRLYSPNKPH